uniref:Uncharacterized protein n=1 Tax=Sphaeramia orbicularis TaxID=375764 RepID=A0A673AMM9_9TELE
MNPADLDQVREAIRSQGRLLGGHEQVLHSLLDKMNQLSTRVSQLTSTQAPATSLPVEPPNIPPPSKYSGNLDTCRNFLTQVQLIFDAQPRRFSCDSAKIDVIAAAIQVSDQLLVWQPESPWVHPSASAAVSNPHDKLSLPVVESGNTSKEEPMQLGR